MLKPKPLVKIQDFFIHLSGVNTEILNREGCKLDKPKYASLGAVLFVTAFLASLSGGYAFFTVFNRVTLASLFGAIWGLGIYIFDRNLVVNIKKTIHIDLSEKSENQSTVNNGQNANFNKHFKEPLFQFFLLFFRLIAALCIAIIVAKPLEYRFFQKEINAEIAILNEQDIKAKIEELPDDDKLTILKEKLDKKITAKEKYAQDKKDAETAWIQEQQGKSRSGKEGDGPISRNIKNKIIDPLIDKISNLEKEIKNIESQIRNREDKLVDGKDAEKTQSIKKTQYNANGLLMQNRALDSLSKKDTSVFWASVFVTLILVIFEILPLLSKVFSKYSNYDAEIQREEETFIYNAIKQRELDNKIIDKETEKKYNTQEQIITYEEEKKLETYQNLRSKVWELIVKKFNQLMQKIDDQNLNLDKIMGNLVEQVNSKLEQELSKHIGTINVSANEVKDMLKDIEKIVLTEIIKAKLEQATSEGRLNDLENDLENKFRELKELIIKGRVPDENENNEHETEAQNQQFNTNNDNKNENNEHETETQNQQSNTNNDNEDNQEEEK